MELAIAIILSIFGFFSKVQDEVERDLVKHHFLSLNQISKKVILKVTIKVDQNTSTFGMHAPFELTCITIKNYKFTKL